jgi:hypothetical protein
VADTGQYQERKWRHIMKKQIAIATVIASIGIAGITQAYANGWGQRGGVNYGNCPFTTVRYNQVDPAIQEKLDTFYNDTQDLRKDIAMKRAEKQALMRAENPDPAELSEVTGELFDLQASMRAKAEEAGVEQYVGPRGPRGNNPGMRSRGNFGGPGKGGRYMSSNMQGQGFRGPRY